MQSKRDNGGSIAFVPKQRVVSMIPGWMVLTRKAAEVAGLAMFLRLIERPKAAGEAPATEPVAQAQAPVVPPADQSGGGPALPPFISEVADGDARYHRARMAQDDYLFVGFYSDGRVRMATPQGRRFSGIMVDQRAVMADLREDVSFEVGVAVHVHADDLLMLEMDGGPYDGQTLQCETVR